MRQLLPHKAGTPVVSILHTVPIFVLSSHIIYLFWNTVQASHPTGNLCKFLNHFISANFFKEYKICLALTSRCPTAHKRTIHTSRAGCYLGKDCRKNLLWSCLKRKLCSRTHSANDFVYKRNRKEKTALFSVFGPENAVFRFCPNPLSIFKSR